LLKILIVAFSQNKTSKMSEEIEQGVKLARDLGSTSEQTWNCESILSTSQEKPITPQAQPEDEAPANQARNNVNVPPPNGVPGAWLHVLGSFVLFFNTWGILNAFGVFQTYYESGTIFSKASSNISWIGAIQSYAVLSSGIIAGPIYDRGYLRTLLVVDSFGVVFGHMMLSISKTYWEVLLAQGFCIGLGAGCLFVPSMSVLPTYFSTKLGLGSAYIEPNSKPLFQYHFEGFV
jgi:hypothetical protein